MAATPPASPSTIGIIAGGGALPFAVADQLVAKGINPFIVAIRGACAEPPLVRFPHQWVALGQFGRALKVLNEKGCHDIVFIGSLIRPSLSDMRFDFAALSVLPKVYASFRGGDDHLLSGVAQLFEDAGHRVLGVQDVAPGLLVPEGCLTKQSPDADALADIEKGLQLLRALGPFDVGQAAVVIDGHVVAVEDIGGTDVLLTRIADLRKADRIRYGVGRGVLIKAPKLEQDLRFDLPTLGPVTIHGVAAAGLAGAAIVAGSALMAEPQKIVAVADAARLFVTGVCE